MLGAVIVILLVLTFLTKNKNGQSLNLVPPINTPAPSLQKVTLGSTVVMVQVANTNALREKGLGGVTNLPADQGMLFVFDKKNLTPMEATFWMKGMLIPLDFIWLSSGKVTQIDVNVPPPSANTPDAQIQRVVPASSIDYVLEVNAGFALKNLIKVGDVFTY